ncbi:MAG TPA: methionine--tRNA ligase [Myxococcaceae bacterium]|nr:methionine--tRNA ligase [Myxococcaceae bacterium]
MKTLITSALPYANGPIHLGHLVEYLQTDIYVRFLKSKGEEALYFCADDTHGTPIELNAQKQGKTPEQFIAVWFEEHQRAFADFGVQFDLYGSTNSEENRHYSGLIYERLKAAGDIDRRTVEQTYCETDKRFLPDRFVRGTCPNCKSPDQYGDVCEKCGKTYAPTDLIDPRCATCGKPPVRKSSDHVFFKLSKRADYLLDLISRPEFIDRGVANQLRSFFDKGLADWDISRDGPYFGFPIPGETDPVKYFYVWLDAPIGYIATTERWAKTTGKAKSALDFWDKGSPGRIVQFVGKDIVYFHALFWPAVLDRAGFKRPDQLVVHGHLTIDGQKMSKTRGNFITARQYLDKLDPTYLRYFYAANLGPGPEDLDLSLNDFRLRVNGELVNNVGNLANRGLTLLAGPLEKRLAPAGDGPGKKLVEEALARVPEVRAAYEKLELRGAVKAILEISATGNQFLQAQAPWAKVKKEPEAARAVLSDAAEVAYLVGALLGPVVPALSEKLFAQLGAPPLTFAQLASAKYPLLDRARPIGTPEPLIGRLEEAQVKAILQVPEESAKPAAPAPAPEAPPATGDIDIADFGKVQLKVGKILAAERVPKADKLLKLSVDLGEGTPRTICSGIAEAYAPEQIVGRSVVVVANLKPRTLRGIESRGMILTAGPGGKDLSLLDPGAMPPGSEVK